MIHNSQQLESNPNVSQMMQNKIWYIYTMEYYSVIKRNQLLVNATSKINVKNMGSDRSQTKEYILCGCIYEMSRKGKFIQKAEQWIAEVRAGVETLWRKTFGVIEKF